MASGGKGTTSRIFPRNPLDYCRLCNVSLRVNGELDDRPGPLKSIRKIFDAPKNPAKEKPLDRRLSAIGVELSRREGASERLCLKCTRSIGHIEKALQQLKEWQAVDDRTTTRSGKTPTKSAPTTPVSNEKRLREPTPTKTPRAVKKVCSARTLKAPPRRTSQTKVTVTYPSRQHRPDNIRCEDNVAVTKGSKPHLCASAAIALRGRDPRLSGFAYYVNTVLQHGGAKKAVFTRLNEHPIKPLELYQVGDSLPTQDTQAHLRNEFIILGSRILTEHVPAFKRFAPVVIRHMPHQYSDKMAQPSNECPLGLLFKNESDTGDLVDILHHIQREYVPRTPEGLQPIFVGGDRLTEGCSRQVQWAFGEGEELEDRLDGLLIMFLDWHAIRNLHGIHHRLFLKEESAREHGTLCANFNKIKRSNAKQGPDKSYNAYKEGVTTETSSLFIGATMKCFGMENIEDEPADFILADVTEWTKEQQQAWLHDTVGKVVDTFIMQTEGSTLADLRAGVEEEARPRHPCREPGCDRSYVYKKARLKHERNVHGLDFGEPDHKEELTAKPPPRDYKKQHTEARLSFGLFLEDMQDAVREGDGERLLRLYTVALLYYRAYGHTQYAYSTLLLTVQVSAILTPAKAHRLTWNRFYNGKGGRGKNIALDLHLEHLNNLLKSFLKGLGPNLTEASAARISRSLGCLKDILQKVDQEIGVASPSGYHSSPSTTQDIHTLVQVINEADLFTFHPDRAFNAFPNFDRNLFAPIKYDKMWQWIKNHLKLWDVKY
ncbi:hypothetical protein Bbelb_119370 [Branchiostoma belcheri]|nr:hypothetical protein Bbelb_119370 [Branchiostoma belcheri]